LIFSHMVYKIITRIEQIIFLIMKLIMKKIVLIYLVTFVINLSAQNFQGIAVYESKTSTEEFDKQIQNNTDVPPEMQQMIKERMRQVFEKTYTLNFNNFESTYFENQTLQADENPMAGMMGSMLGSGGTFFKSTKGKNYTVDKEFFGKNFLVKDTLTTYMWKFDTISKKIGNYTCLRATTEITVNDADSRNLSFLDNPNNENKHNQSKAKTIKTTKIIVTAWYCPDIPISQGPDVYWGLPGLIFEINDGKTTILCSKITLNTKENLNIKPETKGKVVTQKEFDEIVVKKRAEMKESGFGPGSQRGRSGFGGR